MNLSLDTYLHWRDACSRHPGSLVLLKISGQYVTFDSSATLITSVLVDVEESTIRGKGREIRYVTLTSDGQVYRLSGTLEERGMAVVISEQINLVN